LFSVPPPLSKSNVEVTHLQTLLHLCSWFLYPFQSKMLKWCTYKSSFTFVLGSSTPFKVKCWSDAPTNAPSPLFSVPPPLSKSNVEVTLLQKLLHLCSRSLYPCRSQMLKWCTYKSSFTFVLGSPTPVEIKCWSNAPTIALSHFLLIRSQVDAGFKRFMNCGADEIGLGATVNWFLCLWMMVSCICTPGQGWAYQF